MPIGADPGLYDQAYAVVKEVDDIVQSRIAEAQSSSESLQNTALATISALRTVNFGFDAGQLPSPPSIDSTVNVDLNMPVVTPTSFGEVDYNDPGDPSLDPVDTIDKLDIPAFLPSISSLNIPNAPEPRDMGKAPERPTTDPVVLPKAPELKFPDPVKLEEIKIPEFEGLEIPEFDPTAPEFEATALPGILQWSEPTYHNIILDETIAQIRKLWSGGSGIPEAVELAMIERALSREDMIAKREIDSVSVEFSLRGFTMPTGMEAARVDQMRQDLGVKKLALNRELTIKFAEFQIENVRFAVTQSIAAENVLVNIFLNMAERMFNAAKFQIESQISIYNAQVALFNARMNALQIEAQVFDSKVKAELAKIEVFKAEVEGEIARGQINEQRIKEYTALVGALQTKVDVFKAQMQGAAVEADVIKNVIEGYKADVQAYAERVNADKLRYDAYESQVKGEAVKASIIDSEARAFAAQVQGISAGSEAQVARANVAIQKNRMLLEAYQSKLETEKLSMTAQTSVISAAAQAYIADTQRYGAQAQAETAKAQVQVSAKEIELRSNISFYEAQVRAYIGKTEQLIREAGLVIDSLKAAGQIASTLAAGAMAGVHVGANLSGQGAVSASGSANNSYSRSESESKSENINFDGGKV